MKKIISISMIFIIIFNIISCIYIPETQAALSSSYTQNLKVGIECFPKSYQEDLRKLQEIHPDWNFKAYYTGIDWNELTSSSAENKCMKNTLRKIDLTDPAMLCICGYTGDPGYYCASSKTVNYYLDPRNFLIESSIFQFLDLSNTTTLSEETIGKIVSGTYLSNYVGAIIEAANKSDVNPLHIIATIYQELGKKAEIPKGISGTVEGYEGLYNFYNYGATDGAGAVERGLETARGLGWTTPEFALINGAEIVLKGSYISRGQVTKYFYKFDVVGDEILRDNETKTYPVSNFYSHQYMTNIQDPSSQSGMLMEYYTNNGLLNSNLTFVIPVYENMPEEKINFPTTLTTDDGELYYVNTTHVTSLSVRDEANNIVGKLTKGQIVAVKSIQNNRAHIKLKVATGIGLDENEKKKWNYEDRYIYLNDASYLVKCEMPKNEIPDTQQSENNIIKIVETSIRMIPEATIENIKEIYPNAIIKKDDGTETTDSIGTGYKIVIDGIEYTAIKYGDCSSDGKIDSMDMYQIIQHLLGNSILESNKVIAVDVTKDNKLDSMDMYQIIQYLLGNFKINI